MLFFVSCHGNILFCGLTGPYRAFQGGLTGALQSLTEALSRVTGALQGPPGGSPWVDPSLVSGHPPWGFPMGPLGDPPVGTWALTFWPARMFGPFPRLDILACDEVCAFQGIPPADTESRLRDPPWDNYPWEIPQGDPSLGNSGGSLGGAGGNYFCPHRALVPLVVRTPAGVPEV